MKHIFGTPYCIYMSADHIVCEFYTMTIHCPKGSSQGIAWTKTKCSIVHDYYILLHPSIILVADSNVWGRNNYLPDVPKWSKDGRGTILSFTAPLVHELIIRVQNQTNTCNVFSRYTNLHFACELIQKCVRPTLALQSLKKKAQPNFQYLAETLPIFPCAKKPIGWIRRGNSQILSLQTKSRTLVHERQWDYERRQYYCGWDRSQGVLVPRGAVV
jgi:hypothetical protein